MDEDLVGTKKRKSLAGCQAFSFVGVQSSFSMEPPNSFQVTPLCRERVNGNYIALKEAKLVAHVITCNRSRIKISLQNFNLRIELSVATYKNVANTFRVIW